MHKKTLMIDIDGVLNEYNRKFDEKIIPNLRGLEIVLSSFHSACTRGRNSYNMPDNE